MVTYLLKSPLSEIKSLMFLSVKPTEFRIESLMDINKYLVSVFFVDYILRRYIIGVFFCEKGEIKSVKFLVSR